MGSYCRASHGNSSCTIKNVYSFTLVRNTIMEELLLPHLFRTEYRKLVSVLCYLFGIQHIEVAEDIVSDTFLAATEQWSLEGSPENPIAWLYTVAKNKTKNYLKRNQLFEQKLRPAIHYSSATSTEMEIDL